MKNEFKPATDFSRRRFVQAASAGAATLSMGGGLLTAVADSVAAIPSAPRPNRAPLASQPFMLLPLGSVKPTGWLRRQLEIQAAGQSGHLDEFWWSVGPQSGWLGGLGEAWERGPYYLDGLLPLAWLLDSAPLKAKAQKFIDWTLSNAQPSGMIGPKANDDWWPRMVMLKVLTQYHELTQDPRVIPVMTQYFHYQLREMPERPLFEWGRFRWQDEIVSIIWLYNRTGDEQLLELAHLLCKQGWNWRAAFADFPFKEPVTLREDYQSFTTTSTKPRAADRGMFSHGVNNAMGLKASPVWSIVSGSAEDRAAIHSQLATLDDFHGQTIGLYAADEHFAGRNPSRGVELCAVVEAMYSLELAVAITGDVRLADRLERIAYNALPAAFSDDMWTHQYDQQTNQIQCSVAWGPWGTNGAAAGLFGLEPQSGCCTANFHQGWPKLTASLWMASIDGGLAAMVYAPCEVTTVVRDVPVRLSVVTDYPFRDEAQIHLDPVKALSFPLKLRVPSWARGVKVNVNGRAAKTPIKDGFVTLQRLWRKGDRVDLIFDFETRAVQGFNQSVSIEHGPLLFSLPIGERWEKLLDRGPQDQPELVADWEVYPTTAWNYGIDQNTTFYRSERAVPAIPFSSEAPAVTVTVNARPVPQWTTDLHYAPPPPPSPVSVASTSHQRIELIPYAAAKLRITSFPVVK